MTQGRRTVSAPVAAVVALLATFAAGVGVGIAGTRLMSPPLPPPGALALEMTPVLDSLSLSPAQRLQAEAILEARAPQARVALFAVAPALQAVADSLDMELRAILTPAQRLRLEGLRAGQPLLQLPARGALPAPDSSSPVAPP